MTTTVPLAERPRLGISACLLGQPVRFNGGHKQAPVCTQLLGALFDWQPVCPEAAIGLGVPRPPVRLLASDAGLRLVDSRDAQRDHTAPMQAFAQDYAGRALAGLSGFVFMQKSPSCGLYRVPQYRADGHAGEHGAGLFAAAIRAAQPLLPCEEAGRLHDPLIREHFASRVLAYHAWQQLRAAGPQPADLLAFHARHKYQLMAHSPAGLRALGRLLADLRRADFAALLDAYAEGFFTLLAQQPSRRGHANALQHIRGYLKRCGLRPAEQQRLDRALDDYRQGVIPRMVPLALLRQHFDRHPDAYIAGQVYLSPRMDHPVLLHGA